METISIVDVVYSKDHGTFSTSGDYVKPNTNLMASELHCRRMSAHLSYRTTEEMNAIFQKSQTSFESEQSTLVNSKGGKAAIPPEFPESENTFIASGLLASTNIRDKRNRVHTLKQVLNERPCMTEYYSSRRHSNIRCSSRVNNDLLDQHSPSVNSLGATKNIAKSLCDLSKEPSQSSKLS